ncbi:hypothetical protein LTR36_007840 [Oleoguttula mirabilis]|uniref:Uncharacterized protein n=1 Tax=Oleoguttula mirabilis TaxID=1507867 RepID=A0AAV9J9N3_9PEZI|nr:hypothetical protein LTR36_007840 [Oleoguttula mirabilis]
MSLPSSPPLLPEQDLPTLPTFAPIASASNAGLRALNRKRQLSDYGSPSSDPPLFSDTTSDGGDASHYEEQPRRKRLVRGPWWNVGKGRGQSLRRSMAKTERLRNGDSGVWMGSDESEASSDCLISSQQRMQELAMQDMADEEMSSDETLPNAEALAARLVHGCVDKGKEVVDLSDRGLIHLSNATLAPLHQLIRPSFVGVTHPPSEDEFSPLTPSIQLFLSRNQLTALPLELFNLTNISVLSLRNNDLQHLSPAIARLNKLKELNIAGNNISYLPWELLELLDRRGKHRQITVRPNPLIEPCDLSGPSPLPKANFTRVMQTEELARCTDTRDTVNNLRCKYVAEQGTLSMRGELELRLKLGRMLRIQYLQEASKAGRELKLCREELIYLASSAVQYFRGDGTPLRRTGSQHAGGEEFAACLDPTATAPSGSGSASTAPSLFELALHSLQTNFNLQDFLPKMSTFPGISSSLASAIRLAAANTHGLGNETCSTCGKHFIIARAEWMEYWFHGWSSQRELTSEAVLPFLRRVCSWGCARPSEAGEFRC